MVAELDTELNSIAFDGLVSAGKNVCACYLNVSPFPWCQPPEECSCKAEHLCEARACTRHCVSPSTKAPL